MIRLIILSTVVKVSKLFFLFYIVKNDTKLKIVILMKSVLSLLSLLSFLNSSESIGSVCYFTCYLKIKERKRKFQNTVLSSRL